MHIGSGSKLQATSPDAPGLLWLAPAQTADGRLPLWSEEDGFYFDTHAHPVPAEVIPYSYLHPLSWTDEAWDRLMRSNPSIGIAACQVHGS